MEQQLWHSPSGNGRFPSTLPTNVCLGNSPFFCTSNSYDLQAIVLFLGFLFLILLGELKGSHSQLYMIVY